MITANAVLLTNDPIGLEDYGIDRIPLGQAGTYLQNSNPSVLGAHCRPANYQEIISLLLKEKRKNSSKRFLIFYEELDTRQLSEINNLLHPSLTLPYSKDIGFSELFQQSFSSYYELEQAKQLIALVNEKNDELKRLTISLENKIQDRQSQLEKSRKKNVTASLRLKVLKNTLEQIYPATSFREIEVGLNQALSKEFDLAAVKIRLPSQSNLIRQKEDLKFFKTALKSGKDDFGHILFFQKEDRNFDQKEKRFLVQVAEAVSLAIKRIIKYRDNQEAKLQWEATFDAISDPICLTDSDYNILRINAGYLKQTQTTRFDQHIGKKCFQSLFDRDTPCEGCQRGQIFQIRNPGERQRSEIFDVYSNNLSQGDKPIYFQMYRDVTGDLNLQRQVIESAKMAELGTISSSIAHELNNPIGGMLNFIQLMKMDLNGDEDFYQDILEIEKGIVKCKNIVKNLLGFVRKSFNTQIDEVNLSEVIEQAIKITELKTRAIGIRIEFKSLAEHEVFIDGRFNLLTHAIRNILQNSQESLIEKRKLDRSFKGLIEVVLSANEGLIEIDICDNGSGIAPSQMSKIFDPLFTTKDPETNSGLGLTLALQIVKEHQGAIEVSVDKDKKLHFKVRFFKSEVQSGLSEF